MHAQKKGGAQLYADMTLECIALSRWHAKGKFFTMPLGSRGVTREYKLWGEPWIGIKIEGLRGPVEGGLFGIGKVGSQIPETWKLIVKKDHGKQ